MIQRRHELRIPNALAMACLALTALCIDRVAADPHRSTPQRIMRLRQETPHVGPFSPTSAPSLDGSPVEYLILSDRDMAPEFERLAEWKTRKGVPAVVRTLDDVRSTARPGSDLAETIRHYIQDAYRFWGVRFVLLGGDTDVIPARHVEMHIDTRTPISDLYYSCLDGDWNADGDAFFGEEFVSTQNPGDDTDLVSEVFVGRAPVSTADQARVFVDKTLEYEKPSDLSFQDKFLFLAEVLFPSNYTPGGPLPRADGAEFAEEIALRTAVWTRTTRLFEAQALWPGSEALTVQSATNAINSGYGIVVHIGHGWRYTLSSGDGSLDVRDAARFSNGKRCGLFYMLNCAATAFDFESMAEGLLLNPDGGACAVVGAARDAFPLSVRPYQNAFFEHLYSLGEHRVGVALARSREQFVSPTMTRLDRWTQLVSTLLGDPELSIWTRARSDLRIEGLPSNLLVGTQPVQLEVRDANGPVRDARICFRKRNDEYRVAHTDAEGVAWLDLELRSEGDVELTVTAADHVPFETTLRARARGVTLVLTDVGLVDGGTDDGVGNLDGRLDAGETVQLLPRLRNVGTGTARNVTATLRATDPGVEVLQASATYPDLSADVESAPAAPCVLRARTDVPDGSVVTLALDIQHTGKVESRSIALVVYAARPSLVDLRLDDSRTGNGDGIQDPGEEVDLYYSVENRGGGTAMSVELRLESPEEGLSVINGSALVPAVPPGGRAESLLPLTIVERDLSATATARLLLAHLQEPAGSGRRIDFRAPPAPAGLSFGGVSSEDAVHLSWERVDSEDLLGYNVYRSTSATGAFALANTDVVPHAYFRDSGLQPSQRYFYKISALDGALQEGPTSDVVAVSTNPGVLDGWPIETGQFSASTPAVGDLDADGDLELVATGAQVFGWDAGGVELVDADRDPLTWGVLHGSDEGFGSVTLANVDSQAGDEIIVATWDTQARQVIVLNAEGVPVTGWPRPLVAAAENLAGSQVPPVVTNLDASGAAEIIVAARDGRLYGWHADGTEIVDGDRDPSTDGVFLDTQSPFLRCAPGVADLDSSIPGLEVVVGATNGTLHLIDAEGRALPGWPRTTFGAGTPFGQHFSGGIAVADLDRDGVVEMIFVDGSGYLHAMHVDGGELPGFPIAGIAAQSLTVIPSPAIADLQGDAQLEVVVGGSDGRLHVFDAAGNPLLSKPIETGAASETSPLLGDVDGDGEIEIVFGNEAGTLHVWNLDATPVDGFPIAIGAEVRATPILADLDGSGTADLVVQGWDGVVRVHDLGVPWDPERFPWPQHRGNSNHTGTPGVDLPTPVLVSDLEARYVAHSGVRMSWFAAATDVYGEISWRIRRAGPFVTRPRERADWMSVAVEVAEQTGVGALSFIDPNVEPGNWYAYAVLALEGDREIFAGSIVVHATAPAELRLHRAAPNPFNPGTRIVFEIPGRSAAPVHLGIYAVTGRLARVLIEDSISPGTHVVDWDGKDQSGRAMASGVYLVRLRTGRSVLTQKVVRLR